MSRVEGAIMLTSVFIAGGLTAVALLVSSSVAPTLFGGLAIACVAGVWVRAAAIAVSRALE